MLLFDTLFFWMYFYGGCGEVVNAAACGADTRGFDSHQPPQFIILSLYLL